MTGNEPQSFDPHLGTNAYDRLMQWTIAESLVTMDPDGTIVPALAVSWEQPDPQTWVFDLREGVTFHDGTTFNAEAVQYNFERFFDPDTNAPRADSDFPLLDEVQVVDEFTVEITTTAPWPAFLTSLAYEPGGHFHSPAAMEAAGVAEYGTQPVGTGPFEFEEWVQGSHVALVANEEYWGGRPNLDRVTYQVVGEAATRVTLLQTGEAHFDTTVPLTRVAELEDDADIELVSAPTNQVNFVEMSNIQEPFDDPRVRQAVCYALDREAIVDSILFGIPPLNYGVLQGNSWAKDSDVERYEHDPERARELLAEAGYPDGFEITFWHPTERYTGDVAIATAIQAQLSEVGISAQLMTGDITAWASAMRGTAPEEPDATIYFRGQGGVPGDPSSIFALYHSDYWGVTGNYSRYSNPDVDALLNEAQTLVDQDDRADLYQEAEAIVTGEAPLCMLYEEVRTVAHSAALHDVVVGPGEIQLFHRAWLDE